MPELTISVGGVSVIISPPSNQQLATVTGKGVAGSAIAPGQVLYADPSANNQLKPALATVPLQTANVVGIALNSAALNQPVTYAVSGDLYLPSTNAANATLTSGSVYVLAAGTAGNIVAALDSNAPAPGNYASLIGIGNGLAAGTTNILRLTLIPTNVRL